MTKYMGQIMAECDCQHKACDARGYCIADRMEELTAENATLKQMWWEAGDVTYLAGTIADLEDKLRKSALQELSALGQAAEAYQAQLASEAKLAQQDDLVQAAVAAALREAVLQVHSSVPGHMLVSDTDRICDAIFALITPDAQAALDRVVAAALREAAQAARLSISEREEWPPKDGDVLVDDCMSAILALIPKGEDDA